MTTDPATAPTPAALGPRGLLLDRPGAVEADGRDAGIAAHYGDPMREQRLLSEGLAVVDLGNRGVLTITGPDRLSWLHSLTTQQLTGLAPRTSRETLILSPKGHVEHALHVVDDGATTWITTEPDSREAVRAWLDSMRFMLRVEVADVTEEYTVIGEPVAREGAEGEPPTWWDRWPELVGDTTSYTDVEAADHPGHDRPWREVVLPRTPEAVAAFCGERGVAGRWALDALRVMAWRPRQGNETDHRTIPHEVDWLRTSLHLHKGCYRGQETVARVLNLGRPPRRLAFVHLDGSGHTLPAVGSAVTLDEREVGRLTTVARHYESGPVGLVVLRRSTDAEATLVVDGVSAAQETVVRR